MFTIIFYSCSLLLIIFQTLINLTSSSIINIPPDFRVTLKYGGNQDVLRVSTIVQETISSPSIFTRPYSNITGEYHAQFKYRWTQFAIHSKYFKTNDVVMLPSGTNSNNNNTKIILKSPAFGDTTRGVFVADPCFNGIWVPCAHGIPYDTFNRLAWMLNAASTDADYWGILGDNFYDLNGSLSQTFFNQLQPEIKQKPIITVVGNHDAWNWGHPPANKYVQPYPDQVGYGYMQFYAQDTLSGSLPASTSPFNFSFNPDNSKTGQAKITYDLPDFSNFFYYTSLGNTGFIGYSSAHNLSVQFNAFETACSFYIAQAQQPIVAIFLIGHWDWCNDGCQTGMDAPTLYADMRTNTQWNSCRKLANSGKLFFIAGHTHINSVLAPGQGVRVAGQGNYGTAANDGSFGLPLFETFPADPLTGKQYPRLLITYIPIAMNSSEPLSVVNGRYQALQDCYGTTKSLFACGSTLGVVWLDTLIIPPPPPPATGQDTSLIIALSVVFGVLFVGCIGVIAYLLYVKNNSNSNEGGARGAGGKHEGEDEPLLDKKFPLPTMAAGTTTTSTSTRGIQQQQQQQHLTNT
jgi:hypothetical protein